MRRFFREPSAIVVVIIAACVGFLGFSAFTGNIHPPVRFPTKNIPYEPDRIIRTTLHDYLRSGARREHETSGRYVTFGLPMRFLDLSTVYDDEAPVFFRTYTSWQLDMAGSSSRIADVHDAEGNAPLNFVESNRYFAKISSSAHSSLRRLSNELAEAKRSGNKFDGYKRGVGPGDLFWLNEDYCGFEAFERDHARDWHLTANSFEGVPVRDGVVPPFDHARVFGLPDGDGGYQQVIECDDLYHPSTGYCKTDAQLNEFIVVSFSFDGSLVCEIRDVIADHMNLLRDAIIDQSGDK